VETLLVIHSKGKLLALPTVIVPGQAYLIATNVLASLNLEMKSLKIVLIYQKLSFTI
jgi:hypothetical protein